MVSSRLALNRDLWSLWSLWRWINTRQAIEISELSLEFGIQLRFKQLKWLRRLQCSWACHVEVSVSRVANTSGSRAFAWHTFGSLPQWLGQAFSATRSRDVQSGSLRVSSQQTNRTFRRISESRLGNISLVQVLCNAGDLQLKRSISVLTGRERLCRKFTCNAGPTQWAVDATGYFDCFPSGAVWQRIRSLIAKPKVVFLDKLCIAQHDEELKQNGIFGLAGFLDHSRQLTIFWSYRYLSRLWYLCEVARLFFSLLHSKSPPPTSTHRPDRWCLKFKKLPTACRQTRERCVARCTYEVATFLRAKQKPILVIPVKLAVTWTEMEIAQQWKTNETSSCGSKQRSGYKVTIVAGGSSIRICCLSYFVIVTAATSMRQLSEPRWSCVCSLQPRYGSWQATTSPLTWFWEIKTRILDNWWLFWPSSPFFTCQPWRWSFSSVFRWWSKWRNCHSSSEISASKMPNASAVRAITVILKQVNCCPVTGNSCVWTEYLKDVFS